MARSIEYVLSEIVDVSKQLDVDPRTITRSQFLPETDVTKHDLEAYGGFAKLRVDAAHVHGIEPFKDAVQARGVELRNNYVRSLERKVQGVDYLSEKLHDAIIRVFEENPVKLSTKKVAVVKKSPERVLNLLWSDLHFGVDVDPREVLKSEFNWTIAARRMAKLCLQAVQWKPMHRDKTTLKIILNGDIVHGVIHLSEGRIKPITEQIYGASAILIGAVDYLRQHFSKIEIVCLPGNHDRTVYKGPDRAISQRWDSHTHSVYLAMKCAFRAADDITFDIPMSGIGTYETPGGHLIFASHGDTAPSVGNVSKSLNVNSISDAVAKMNSSGAFSKRVEVALFGHWHSPSIFMLSDGTVIIVNGCLIGSESYGQNVVGSFNSMPAQIMFESIAKYPVGDSRIVQLRDADTDTSYDKVIRPPALAKSGGIDFDL